MAARLVNVPPEPNKHVRHEHRVLGVLAQMAIDAGQQLVEALGRGRVGIDFAQPHGAQLRGVDGLDQVAEGQHDLGAAAADVDHGHVLVRQVEGPLHAGEGQQGLLLGADDFDLDAQLFAGPAAELVAVGRFAHGAGGDRLELA